MKRIEIKTDRREEFVDITRKIEDAIDGASGICLIFVPHTTAGITINEAADPDVVADIEKRLSELVPKMGNYSHLEGNSDAHIKASIIGSSVTVGAERGKLALGRWQGVFFCEFDGPRRREVWISIGK
jgi:secondary thiamine-phosphate synthase enzyme